jgi:TPR repeat protein
VDGDHNALLFEMVLLDTGTKCSLVPQDSARTAQLGTELLPWLRREVKRGTNTHALFGLGYCYHCSVVLRADQDAARDLLTRAGDAGHALASYYLANIYSLGQGVEQDEARAAALYKQAANLGITEAMIELGMCLEKQRKRKLAFSEYQKAADLGHCMGQHNVGVCYHNNFGVPRDRAEGDRWLRRAAEQGYSAAIAYFAADPDTDTADTDTATATAGAGAAVLEDNKDCVRVTSGAAPGGAGAAGKGRKGKRGRSKGWWCYEEVEEGEEEEGAVAAANVVAGKRARARVCRGDV